MVEKILDKRIIDMVRIHDIFGDDDAAIREFFLGFIEATTELLKDIKKAISTKDEQLAKVSLHRLKGSAGNSGVMGIHKLCIKAEEELAENNWTGLESHYQDICEIFKKLQERLKETNIPL